MCFEGVVVTCSKFKLQTILDMSTEKMPPTLPLGSVGRSSSSRGNEDNNSYRLKYRGQTEHEQGEVVNNRIYVGGLGDCIGERDLFHFFSKFGPVQHVGIITTGGFTKGYGFVTFHSSEVVGRILTNPDKENLVLKGRKLFVGAARQRASQMANWGGRGEGHDALAVDEHGGHGNSTVGKEVDEKEVTETFPPPTGSQPNNNDAIMAPPSYTYNSPAYYYQETAYPPMTTYPTYYQQYQHPAAASYNYNTAMVYYPTTQYQDPTMLGQGQQEAQVCIPYQHDQVHVPNNHVVPMPYHPIQQANMCTPINYYGHLNMMPQYYVNTEDMTQGMPQPSMMVYQDQNQQAGYHEGYPPTPHNIPPVDVGVVYPDNGNNYATYPSIAQVGYSPDISELGDSGFQDTSSRDYMDVHAVHSNQSHNDHDGHGHGHASNQNEPDRDGRAQGHVESGHGPRMTTAVMAAKSSGPNIMKENQQRNSSNPKASGESRAPPEEFPSSKDYGRGSRGAPMHYRSFPPFPRNIPPGRQFAFPPGNGNHRPWYSQRGRGRVWGHNAGNRVEGNVRWNVAKRKPGKKAAGNDVKKVGANEEVKVQGSGGLGGNQPDILQGPLEKLEIK